MTPKELALALAKTLDEKKGGDIRVLETARLTTLADYFVICTAASTTQIKALCDACEKAMMDLGRHRTISRGTVAGFGSARFFFRRGAPFYG